MVLSPRSPHGANYTLRPTVRRRLPGLAASLFLGLFVGTVVVCADGGPDSGANGSLVRDESGASNAPMHFDELPAEVRVALQDTFRTRADGLFHITPFKRLRSERFTVLTDIEDNETVRLISGNLEQTFAVLDSIFAGDSGPADQSNLSVYVYRSREQFAALAGMLGTDNADGLYAPPLQSLVFHMQLHSNQVMAQVMLHEATHAYLDNHVRPPAVTFPLWFEEGLAEYVGTSSIYKGELQLGAVRRKQRYRNPLAAVNIKSEAMTYVELLKKSLRREGQPTLGWLLGSDRDAFYGEESRLYYASAWIWVHFMRHGGSDHSAGRFPDFIARLRDGVEPVQAVSSVYGELPELEPRFHDYIRKFRPM